MALEQEIVRGLQEKIVEYEEKIQALRQAMNAFQGEGNGSSSSSIVKRRGRRPGSKNVTKVSSTKVAKSRGRKPRTRDTFENTIVKLLEDGTPKTTRSLLDLYNKTTGRNLEVNGFSARLSILKKNGSLKSAKNPADKLSYFGPVDWFKKGKLKSYYQLKIKS